MLRYEASFPKKRQEKKNSTLLKYIAVRHPDDKGLSNDIAEYIVQKILPTIKRIQKPLNKLRDKIEQKVLKTEEIDIALDEGRSGFSQYQKILDREVKSKLEQALEKRLPEMIKEINIPNVSIGDFLHEEPDFLSDPEAQKNLEDVVITFDSLQNQRAEGIYYSSGLIIVDIYYLLINFYDLDRETIQTMKEHVRTILAHELNHAIADAYKKAKNVPEISEEVQEAFDSNPMLDKDERIAYVYNIASITINHINGLNKIPNETEILNIAKAAYSKSYGFSFPSPVNERDFFRRVLTLVNERLSKRDFYERSRNPFDLDKNIQYKTI